MSVSVIVPTFCRASLLCEAVDSVLLQDTGDCEIIIVDDGSTDDTRDRVQKYGKRVRYVHQENQGLSVARNTALSIASREYVAFLDDDDWWMPGKLSLQLQVLERFPDISGVFTDFTIYRGPGDVTRQGMRTWYDSPPDWSTLMDSRFSAGDLHLESSLVEPGTQLYIGSLYGPSLEDYFVLPSTAIVRRSVMSEDLEFPPHDPICGDWEFFARLSNAAPLCFVDCDTAYNRSHSDGYRLTKTRAIRQLALQVDFLERVYVADEAFYKKHKPRVDNIWKDRLAHLCRLQMLESEPHMARATAKKLRDLDGGLGLSHRLTMMASVTPGSGALMRMVRSFKRFL